MQKALKFLRDKEWSMGNGQCPTCYGVPESWFGHPLHMKPETIGHKDGCERAEAIKELGGEVVMQGDFKSDVEWESFISDSGMYGTRKKRPGVPPCPRLKRVNEEFRDAVMADILNAMKGGLGNGT